MPAHRKSEARLLTALASAQADTRKGLEGPLGLGKAAISLLTDRLIREGRLSEGAKVVCSTPGRKSVALEVRPDLGYVLGTDLEGLAIRACILDCAHQIVASAKCEVAPGWTSAKLLRQWELLLERLLRESQLDPKRIVGIGAGLPGIVTPGRPATRAFLPPGRWADFDAGAALARFGLPVTAANNVLCVAEYERRLGAARGRGSFMLVLARYGLGAALFGHGGFLVGGSTFTCELGHMRIDRNGPKCICGRRGCLDVAASGRTLPPPQRRRGPGWDRELNRRMAAMGVATANLLKVFHPPLVLFDGLYEDYEKAALPALQSAIREELAGVGLSVPELRMGGRAEFKASLGAALRAADAFLEKHLLSTPAARTTARPVR